MATTPERRELSFQSLEEVLAEVERLITGNVETTGHHDFGAILNHLALSHDVSSGQMAPPPAPFFMKLMTPLLRWMVINAKPLKAGVKLPAQAESFFWPDKNFDVQEAFEEFKASIERYKANGPLATHPFFGKMTKQQCDDLQCRHAALHLSFVHPTE